MLVKRGYRVELDLNNEQITLCRKHCGAARWAYNYGLHRKQEAYKAGEKTPYGACLHREINALKQTDIPWMYEVSKCAAQEALRDLDEAFKHFFRKGSATISEKTGRWYVSMCVHAQQAEPTPATGEVIGVDLGIKTLATLSDGRTFDNPKALRKKLTALKRTSRRHSRKKKGSQNRQKAKQRLAKMNRRIANVRKDALHKATSAIMAKTKPDSERPRVIVLEDLNVSGMLKNRKLSRACADVGLYEFRRQVEYKAKFAGSEVLFASRWEPSSKTCSCCGWVKEDLTLETRVFICEECAKVQDRDYNAARNLAALA